MNYIISLDWRCMYGSLSEIDQESKKWSNHDYDMTFYTSSIIFNNNKS